MELTAALMALLLLSYASVRSIVMQAAMAAPPGASADAALAMAMPMASVAPARMAPAHAPASHHRASSNACPYCAAAAHAPIIGQAAPWRASTAFSFTAFRTVASRGARGPPAFRPRARGPPSTPSSLSDASFT